MKIGSQSETGKLRTVLMKHAKDAFISDANLDRQWKDLQYLSKPDYAKCLTEYEEFASIIADSGCEIHYLPESDTVGLDSIYARDPIVLTKKGAILCTMGKDARKPEAAASAKYFESIGLPILGEITGEGTLECGDIIWLNEKTLAVGLGYRTNEEGIRQLMELTDDLVDEFIVVPLPHWTGPADCLHLMSNISPVANDKAVVYSRLLTVQFRNLLLEKGIQLIEVPDSEYMSMACNVLALEPNKVIMIKGNPITKSRLEEAGVEVFEYSGAEISLKGAGGPTCLTRPLLRD